MCKRIIPCLLCFVAVWAAGGTIGHAAESEIDFATQIQPLLVAHCNQCHGATKHEAGLRLDHPVPGLRGGDSGPAIVAGKPEESELFRRISSDDESERMPPADGRALSAEQILLVKRWISEGAKWPDDGRPFQIQSDHWAFQPLKSPELPAVTNAAWVKNPIDRFVLARLEAKQIAPSPPADSHTLVKRLYYDLIGLPPDWETASKFAQNPSPEAYAALVDKLLASEHFGERWGRHWLDKARYADSDGYEKDNPRLNAWKYRDWVIDAINRDLAFDEFTIEQLAGDLIPNKNQEQYLATAFHRQTLTNTEGGADQEQFRVEAIFDRVSTTGVVWLGLTVGCAQCHSHKYDPITQTEFYQLFAFFNNADETKTKVPVSSDAVAKYEQALADFQKQLHEKQQSLAVLQQAALSGFSAWRDQLRDELTAAADDEVKYHPLTFTSATAGEGTILTKQEDGSLLAEGPNPESNDYTLVTTVPVEKVNGLRLDVLPDESLGSNGPGRTKHGNFVVSRLRIWVATDGGEEEWPLAAATADFSQKNYQVDSLLPGKSGGWAISPQMGKAHWAEFSLAKPLPARGELRIVLEQHYGSQHTLGRFRLQAMTGTKPASKLAADVRQLLVQDPATLKPPQLEKLHAAFFATVPQVSQAMAAVAEFQRKTPASPQMDVDVLTQRTGNFRSTYVLRRGDFLDPVKEQSLLPGTLAVLPPFRSRDKDQPGDRYDLAQWFVSQENPLPPRVAVNHIFSHLFGRGLVRSRNDFGTRGEKPTHPELLDWLADQFRRPVAEGGLGWSRKALVKLLVTSAAYQQSSSYRAELSESDPNNDLLYRQNRFRVEAEIVRDLNLSVSGLLSAKVGGPSVFPPMPADIAALSYANNFKWKTSDGEDRYRRGMYTFFKRTSPYPNLTSFDCPDANTTSVARATSNTPLQALILLNNETFSEAAQALTQSILEATAETDAQRLQLAWQRCLVRPPTDSEQTQFLELLAAARTWYEEHPADAAKLIAAHPAKNVSPAENAAWVATLRMITNLDEFITRE